MFLDPCGMEYDLSQSTGEWNEEHFEYLVGGFSIPGRFRFSPRGIVVSKDAGDVEGFETRLEVTSSVAWTDKADMAAGVMRPYATVFLSQAQAFVRRGRIVHPDFNLDAQLEEILAFARPRGIDVIATTSRGYFEGAFVAHGRNFLGQFDLERHAPHSLGDYFEPIGQRPFTDGREAYKED